MTASLCCPACGWEARGVVLRSGHAWLTCQRRGCRTHWLAVRTVDGALVERAVPGHVAHRLRYAGLAECALAAGLGVACGAGSADCCGPFAARGGGERD